MSLIKDPNKILIKCTPKKRSETKSNCPRGSQFRGVSRNGHKWQVSIIHSYILFIDKMCILGASPSLKQEEVHWTNL